MLDESLLLSNAIAYAESRGASLRTEARLGHGTDGAVWKTSTHFAVKAFAERRVYEAEVECYRRLEASGISQIGVFAVPELEGSDDSL